MSVIERRIDGMSCGHCRSAVAGAIGDLDGVRSVAVDLVTETATIEYDGVLDETALAAAVDDAGYTLLP